MCYRFSALLFVAGAASMGVFVTSARADAVAIDRKDWPSKVTVTAGEIRTRIEGEKLWTISGIDFQNAAMATEDSAYGTVITIRNVGHLGTAHFLDVPGKPGEIEKENVTSFRMMMDGKPIDHFEPVMNVAGKSFRMERTSKIRDLDLKSSVEIDDGVLMETSTWHATKAIDLQMSYPLMYAWNPDMTDYAFGDDNGIQKTGRFKDEGKSDDSGREKTAKWMAVFNSKSGKGGVCYLVQRPKQVETFLQWTDAPHIYRKLRVMTFVEQIVPEGFDGTYQSAIGFFTSTESDWKTQAAARVESIKTAIAKTNSQN